MPHSHQKERFTSVPFPCDSASVVVGGGSGSNGGHHPAAGSEFSRCVANNSRGFIDVLASKYLTKYRTVTYRVSTGP